MARTVKIPATKYPVERFTLPNGLRVVVAPDRSAPVIGVAVVYDVGIRSEPEGRTGFAHLFEHLMFQGSENLEKLAHFRHVQGAGGTFNGSTHLDYTDYFETLPANALERALFLEADRMRGPRLTEENLRNQVDVVKEEIRVNVLNRPYGGFPWLKLPPVMFDTFPNAHDGYGSFEDLESATVADAAEFFDRYYACGNAVLSVAGDLDVDEARDADRAALRRRAGPARAGAPRLRRARPHLRAPGDVHRQAGAPARGRRGLAGARPDQRLHRLPAVRRARRGAHRRRRGPAGRAPRAARPDGDQLGGYLGFMGEPFEVRDPTALLLQAHLPPGGDVDKVLRTIDEELDRVAADGLGAGELARIQARMATHLLRDTDAALGRALRMAVLEQQRGAPELLNDLPRLVGEVTEAQVRAAAAALSPNRRAAIDVVAGAGS